MFKAPFSFDGRIRRTEYGLTLIINAVASLIVQLIVVGMAQGSSRSYSSSDNSGGAAILFLIFLIPLLWFGWAQGAKRCHDLGNSGWWQLIPFYGFWLLFADGQHGSNQYGDNPKGIQNNNQQTNFNQPIQNNPGAGYQGGYSGGHNNPNSTNPNNPNQSNSGEYQSGDLYR